MQSELDSTESEPPPVLLTLTGQGQVERGGGTRRDLSAGHMELLTNHQFCFGFPSSSLHPHPSIIFPPSAGQSGVWHRPLRTAGSSESPDQKQAVQASEHRTLPVLPPVPTVSESALPSHLHLTSVQLINATNSNTWNINVEARKVAAVSY